MKKIVVLLIFFIILALGVITGFTSFLDDAIYSFFASEPFPLLVSLSKIITFLANPEFIVIITLILIFILNTNYKRLFLIINTVISASIIIISKNIFYRPRPLIGQLLLTSYSFPSGHSLIATTYYGFLIYLLKNSNFKNKTKYIGISFLTTLIILISLSRIVLNVHYLTDILAGITLGLIILNILIIIYEKYNKKKKERPLVKTLKYGFEGILYTLKTERNMVIHFLVMTLVLIAGFVFEISFVEWIVCFLLFALVLSLELVNTAIENVVDLVTDEKKLKAKRAKDAAAGAVLVAVIFAVIIGIGIFLPRLLNL